MLRWKADASESQKRSLREGLERLREELSVIRDYRFGDDAGLAASNFDFAIVADFDDAEAYRVYADHPAHEELIRTLLRPILAERVAVQYRADP